MKPKSIEEASELIGSNQYLFASGGRSKTAIEAPDQYSNLDMSSFSGIKEYEPSEYTFTAFAGTRLDEIESMLAENDQFLPFDPPLLQQGSTIGGTVASGLSGPGRYRFGGIRDFILGVNYLNHEGILIHAGGKVVKNAAGFDISKLMVGSYGCFGALVEVSMKVFPRPNEYVSIFYEFDSYLDALGKLSELTASPIEIFCLDLKPKKTSTELIIRLGGNPAVFPERIERLKQILTDIRIVDGDDEILYWRKEREFDWLNSSSFLVKIPITPKLVPDLEDYFNKNECERRYSAGANIVWVAWAKPIDSLDNFLNQNGLAGRKILGSPGKSRIGIKTAGSFYKRIKLALDPSGKWAEV